MKKIELEVLQGKTYEEGEKILKAVGYYNSDSAQDNDCPSADYVTDEYWTLEDEDGKEIDIKTFEQFYNGDEIVREGWNDAK